MDDVDLSTYRAWCLKVASTLAPYRPSDWQDIAQEGLIAMWKSLDKYDPSKGALPSWITRAARMRMSDVIRRETWTGTPMRRGHRREKPALPVDLRAMENDEYSAYSYV